MSSDSQVAESWISSFCGLLGHEYFAEVSEDFIEDDFNLTGLQSQVPMYKEALEMILDVEPEEDEEDEEEELDEDEDDDVETIGKDKTVAPGYRRSSGSGDKRHMRMSSDLSVIESSAELLYGLIHQRYITSRPGIQQMAEKYDMQHFGSCPRVLCNGCRVLPVGLSDTPGQETVKLFCPSCLDVYTPPNSRFQSVDGAFFGTTFPSLFFMTFPEFDVGLRASESVTAAAGIDTKGKNSSLTAQANNISLSSSSPGQPPTINGVLPSNYAPGLGEGKIYEPRIYGFRVSERAKSGPRMQWLRMKPADLNELDEGRRYCEQQQQQRRRRQENDTGQMEDEGDGERRGQGQGQEQEQGTGDRDETMVDRTPQKNGRRKAKAVTRRRRTASGSTAGLGGGGGDGGGGLRTGSPMSTSTNGIGQG